MACDAENRMNKAPAYHAHTEKIRKIQIYRWCDSNENGTSKISFRGWNAIQF
jgi:hypothetical protein